MPRMLGLPDALMRFGLTVELLPNWKTAGDDEFNPGGSLAHWTAGPRGTTRRASLGVVTHGRPGLPGPLCNDYLDRDGIVVVVASGRANHAGKGGLRGLAGNSSVLGTEAESGGDGDWTAAQRWAYPRVIAAHLWLLNRDASWAFGHNEWAPTRKIDIRDWTMDLMRRQVAELLAGGPAPISGPTTVNEIINEQGEDMFRIRVAAGNADAGNVYLVRFGPTGECCFTHVGPAKNEALERGGVPLRQIDGRDFSQYEKDLMRVAVVELGADWRVH